MVEHRLAKARVASSNLVSRSNPSSGSQPGLLRRIGQKTVAVPPYSLFQGAVPKW